MPRGDVVRVYLSVVVRLSILFAIVYSFSAWISLTFQHKTVLYLDWERHGVPFVPQMVYAYFSIALVFLLPLFTLDANTLLRLERAFAYATILAGSSFLVLNAKLGFDRPAVLADANWLLRAMYAIDPPRNLVPSLHVLYAGLILRIVAANSGRAAVRFSAAAWFVLLSSSALLVHQHHLLDVFTGGLLGWFAAEWVIRSGRKRAAQ